MTRGNVLLAMVIIASGYFIIKYLSPNHRALLACFFLGFFLKTLAKAVYHIYITRKGCYVESLFKVEQVDTHATSAYVEFTSPTDFKKYQLSYSSTFEANFMAKDDWNKPVKIRLN